MSHWKQMQYSCLKREDVVGTTPVADSGPAAAERVDGAPAHAAAPAGVLDLMAEQAEVRAKARPVPSRPTREEVENHNPTHVVSTN